MKQRKIKHSIADKIGYGFIVITSIVVFIWDIVKDFIPEDLWQLKLLVAIVGALSGFFTILSFFLDKKFSNMTNETSVAYDKKIDALSQKIDTFIEEDIHSYAAFNDAIRSILNSQSEFENVKIFAYSAKNYIDYLTRSQVKIKKLTLCLKRANDFSAWYIRNETYAKKYQKELETTIENLKKLKEKKQIESYDVRFYDFESYTHFGIFNNWLLFGDLIPLFSENKTVQIGNIYTLLNIGRNMTFFNDKDAFFDKIFDSSGSDSGLKISKVDCRYCDTAELIQNPHHMDESSMSFCGKCDVSLVPNIETIEDFLLEPDFHPISDLHMLLVSKFHILNLYDYLYHKNAIEKLEKLVYSIRNTIYKKKRKEIILFEHGTAIEGSSISASSLEHLHVHIIYEPQSNDYIKDIVEDNKKTNIYDSDRGMIRFHGLQDFAQSSMIKNKDYFMIWKPGENRDNSQIYVWIPNKKSSQYLRKIFFQGLSQEEKKRIYGEATGEFYEDEYDWKKHKFEYSNDRLSDHKELGKLIEDDYKRSSKPCKRI